MGRSTPGAGAGLGGSYAPTVYSGRSTPGAGAGLGGAYAPVSFANPNAPATPPPGTGTAPGAGTGAGSYTPDWASLISGDAGLKAAQAALNAGGAADQNALNSEFANAYEGFGKPIDLATLAQQLGMSQADIQQALGPDVQRLAQENTSAGLSTTARLDQANQKAIRQITAELNKRGILNSGESGYQLDQQNLGYRQAQQDAYSKFLGYLQQYQQGYLTAQNARAQSLAQAYSAAADRQYNLNSGYGGSGGSGGSGGGGTPPPPGGSPPPPAENKQPQLLSLAQAIQQYGPTPQQRVRFIGT